MLIEKRNAPNEGDVVTIKLNSGEEVIGRLVDQTIDSVMIAKPVTVQLTPVSPKEMGIQFAPYLASCDKDIEVRIMYSAMAVRPVKSGGPVASSYLQATTNLVSPTEKERSLIS